MMKNLKYKIPFFVFIFGSLFLFSHIAIAQSTGGLVPCTDGCNFNDVMTLINNLITFLITVVFPPIVIILFMYAGFQYITAGGNPSKKANIKAMIWHIIIGMLLVLCSWLIVKTILTILTSDPNGALQFLK